MTSEKYFSVRDAIARACSTGLLQPGGLLLVACSGGADSVALAAAIAERSDLRASLGHIDHGLRADSAEDAEQVRALAARLGLPFFLERLSGLAQSIAREGLEGAAREARYLALQRLALRADATLVATAHTQRDQAETVLLRLARGAGPGALAGVRARRPLGAGVELVRPLLGVPRRGTEALCAELGLPILQDPHNADPARARGRLRALWPVLERALRPNLEKSLASVASLLAGEDELLSALSQSALLAATTPEGLLVERLRAVHPALLRRALLTAARARNVRPERDHLDRLIALLPRRRFSLALPGGFVHSSGGFLRVEGAVEVDRAKKMAAPPIEVLAIERPGRYAWQGREFVVPESPPGNAVKEGAAMEGHLVDLSRAPFPWILRGHRPGDRFRPGLGRTKKVADLWIDARIPREQRKQLAVLSDASGILFFVEGVREGEQSRGELRIPQAFALRPEMDVSTARFLSLRSGAGASATMTGRSSGPGEEPR